jgi:hypothetical protein
VVRELELADPRRAGPGEGPAFVPNIALEQFGGQRGAIDLDERLGAAPRPAVQLARDDFLAHAAFAAKQDGDVAVGDASTICSTGSIDGPELQQRLRAPSGSSAICAPAARTSATATAARARSESRLRAPLRRRLPGSPGLST